MALGGAYLAQAIAIEDSLLSDAVGAGGVPKGIGALMIGAGALLALCSVRRFREGSAKGEGFAPHLKALGLLALLAAYVLLLPVLGYAPAILLLLVAIAAYAGAPLRPPLLLFGLGMTAVLWGSFVGLLHVPFPRSALGF